MELFDTHAHLNDEVFDPIRDDVLARAKQVGVTTVLCVGTDVASSRKCVRLGEQYPSLLAAVGIHPNYCHQAEPGDWEAIVALAENEKVAAIGETGLDRYWHEVPIELQRDYFDRQIRLSQSTGLPFIVHLRDCDDDVLDMLREARRRGPLRGVMHSFSGRESTALECLELGMHISFAGMVTYKKSDELRHIASLIPDDRILVETDSPYLSPHPFRSQRPNEPGMLVHTASCLAQVRNVTVEELAVRATENARRLFCRSHPDSR